MQNKATAWGCALATCAPFLAAAQADKRERPQTHPKLTYRSAFADYKLYRDAQPIDWRELNDQVAGGSGGASGHAGRRMGGMEGTEMVSKPAVPANAAMPMKTSPRHQGHAQQGGTP